MKNKMGNGQVQGEHRGDPRTRAHAQLARISRRAFTTLVTTAI